MGIEEDNELSVDKILDKAGIRTSPVRVLTLRELLKAEHPLSAQEIEIALQTVDRSSITRTLATFADEHIIHQISDGSGSMKYEVCHDLRHEVHDDEHAHFHCRKCGRTICLNGVSATIPDLPDGYRAESVTYVVSGLCPKCN